MQWPSFLNCPPSLPNQHPHLNHPTPCLLGVHPHTLPPVMIWIYIHTHLSCMNESWIYIVYIVSSFPFVTSLMPTNTRDLQFSPSIPNTPSEWQRYAVSLPLNIFTGRFVTSLPFHLGKEYVLSGGQCGHCHRVHSSGVTLSAFLFLPKSFPLLIYPTSYPTRQRGLLEHLHYAKKWSQLEGYTAKKGGEMWIPYILKFTWEL